MKPEPILQVRSKIFVHLFNKDLLDSYHMLDARVPNQIEYSNILNIIKHNPRECGILAQLTFLPEMRTGSKLCRHE